MSGAMRFDDTTLARWRSLCDPMKPLDLDDPRFIDVDREGWELRGREVLLPLLDCILLANKRMEDVSEDDFAASSCQLFSGFRGGGKTSLLQKLAQDLRNEGFAVVLADAARFYNNRSRPVTVEEILVAVGAAISEGVAEDNEINDSKWKGTRFFDRIKESVSGLRLDKEFEVDAGVLKARLFNEPGLWTTWRGKVSDLVERLETQVHRLSAEAGVAAERAGKRGFVLLFDSLEKVKATEKSLLEVIESVGRLFQDERERLALPGCHVVYTVPPYLELMAPEVRGYYSRPMVTLPAVKLRRLNGDEELDGVSAMKDVVRARVDADAVFDSEDTLEVFVKLSGGHLRTLVSMLNEAVLRLRRRSAPIDLSLVREIGWLFARGMRNNVSKEDRLILRRVRADKQVSGVPREERRHVARLLDSNAILCYANGSDPGEWYDLHPFVVPLVEGAEAL